MSLFKGLSPCNCDSVNELVVNATETDRGSLRNNGLSMTRSTVSIPCSDVLPTTNAGTRTLENCSYAQVTAENLDSAYTGQTDKGVPVSDQSIASPNIVSSSPNIPSVQKKGTSSLSQNGQKTPLLQIG